MTTRIWALGAPDPEIEMIEKLLRECGESVVYAVASDGSRVTPGTAYRCLVPEVPDGATVYAVECIDVLPAGWVRIDHHRPGDPGYGQPPEEFLPASSIGQVIAELAWLGRLPAQWRIVLPASQCQNRDADGQVNFGAAGWVVQTGWIREPSIPLTADGAASGGAALVQIPHKLVLAAAADHCLAAAYRGECPGVDPDALME